MVYRKKQRNAKKKEPVANRLKKTIESRDTVNAIKLGICVISGLLIVFGALHIYNELLKSSYLSIREIKVTGNMRLARAEILELAGVDIGDNLLAIDITNIQKNIRLNPWVAQVKGKRDFLDGLSIDIKERNPIAFINLDALYLVDEAGVIFKKASLEDEIDLPVITGLTREDIEEENAKSEFAIKAVNLIHLLTNRTVFEVDYLSEINIDKTYGLTLYTMREGTRIELGNDNFAEKLDRLERVIKSRNGLEGIEFVGLNHDKGVVVRLVSKEVPASNGVRIKAKTQKI